MARPVVVLLGLATVGALAACAGVSDLSGPAPRLGDHVADVRAKADEARKAHRHGDAWNLEAQAGADRARLEAIALDALAADAGPYEDMLKALRAKFGGLSPEGRARVDGLVRDHEGAGRFDDALDVELVAADDPPAFAKGWELWRRAPAKDALGLLEKLEQARADAGGAAK